MKSLKYFTQFLIIIFLFTIFKFLGLKSSSYISSKIMLLVGPFFRSKNLIRLNISKGLPNLDQNEIEKISKKCVPIRPQL